jgi:tellurite resistance protein TerC
MRMITVAGPLLWGAFIAFVLVMLALDLGIFHRKAHVVRFREALGWSLVWVALALAFGAWVYVALGRELGIEFVTGYLIEKSLSVDNIFVFVVIFSALGIPAVHQHRVLFWGVLSALLLRAAMIFGGTALLARFHWLIYVFGAFLVLTGVKLFVARDREMRPEDGLVLRLSRRLIPNTPSLHGARFFVRQGGAWLATPLFMALLLVEVTDVIFALDSIPAIFAVTRDPFIVFTSNIFAILGLRSLFFVLAEAIDKFAYLKVGLAGVLVFVGAKMLLVDVYKLPSLASLAVIFSMLAAAVLASLLKGRVQRGSAARAAVE